MKKYYHGNKRRGSYFEGWYLKLLTKDGEALALIPAFHIDHTGKRSASLQIISPNKTWWLEYPAAEFHACEKRFQIQVGQSSFTDNGIFLKIETEDLSLHGTVHFGPFFLLKSDIMGPFHFLPRMECSHGVISMAHSLEGQLTLNGDPINFAAGTGYIETDRGDSFPSTYLWTQCTWREARQNSLMLSIATIPLPMGGFSGCICAVVYQGKEYRLATYLGAKIEKWGKDGAIVRQGSNRLIAEVLEGTGHPLRAPVKGDMGRTIHESLCTKLRYRFMRGKELVFEHTDNCAGFEYADGPGSLKG